MERRTPIATSRPPPPAFSATPRAPDPRRVARSQLYFLLHAPRLRTVFFFLACIRNMAQTVRVRHNGQVTEISALTLDESHCGGAEIFSQIALQLGLPRERMRVIHRGRLLTPESISRVLRDEPAAIVQVLGIRAVTLQRPLWARVRDAWDALLLLLYARASGPAHLASTGSGCVLLSTAPDWAVKAAGSRCEV